jgi:hypothetical protein
VSFVASGFLLELLYIMLFMGDAGRRPSRGTMPIHRRAPVSLPKTNEYVWAEIGALVGAVLAFPFAAVVFVAVFMGVGFERLEDLTRTGIISFGAGTLVLIVGSALGCWLALRKAGYPLASSAARMHFLLLFVFLVAAVGSPARGAIPLRWKPHSSHS